MNKDQHEITKSKVGVDTEGSIQVLFLPHVASMILTPSFLVWNWIVEWIWSFYVEMFAGVWVGFLPGKAGVRVPVFWDFKYKILNEFYNMPCFRSPVGQVTTGLCRILNSFLCKKSTLSWSVSLYNLFS